MSVLIIVDKDADGFYNWILVSKFDSKETRESLKMMAHANGLTLVRADLEKIDLRLHQIFPCDVEVIE